MMSDLHRPHDFGLGMQPRNEFGQAYDATATLDNASFVPSSGCDPVSSYHQQGQAPASLMNALSSNRIQLQSFLQQRRGVNREQQTPQRQPYNGSTFASVLTDRSKPPSQPTTQPHHLSQYHTSQAAPTAPVAPDTLSTSEMIRQEVVSAFSVSESTLEFSTHPKPRALRVSQSESAMTSLKRRSPGHEEAHNTSYLDANNAEHAAAAMVVANKKQKRALNDSLLHHSCKLFSQDHTIIESALQLDPEAVRYTCPILCLGATKSTSTTSETPRLIERPATFKYALNIALKHHATSQVVEVLVHAGPDVCMEPDGPMEAGSLSIALEATSTASRTDDLVRVLLAANPQCATMVDRHYNTALHCAARLRHVSVSTVSQIQRAHPAALVTRNFYGCTPLQVAQRSGCSEDVLNYLQTLAHCRQDDALEKGLDTFDSLLQVRCESTDPADDW